MFETPVIVQDCSFAKEKKKVFQEQRIMMRYFRFKQQGIKRTLCVFFCCFFQTYKIP